MVTPANAEMGRKLYFLCPSAWDVELQMEHFILTPFCPSLTGGWTNKQASVLSSTLQNKLQFSSFSTFWEFAMPGKFAAEKELWMDGGVQRRPRIQEPSPLWVFPTVWFPPPDKNIFPVSQLCHRFEIHFACSTKALQELRLLSSVTPNCHGTKIVMNSGLQLSEL